MRVKSIIFFLLLCNFGFAQKNLRTHLVGSEKKGDNLFYLFSYNEALDAYKVALKQNPDEDRIELKIAETYRFLNRPEKAAEYYSKVIKNQNVIKPIHKLHYAQSLSASGHYDQARDWYQSYSNDVKNDMRSERSLTKLKNIDALFKDSLSYYVNSININSEQSDFSPTYYDEGIVFVSSREPKKGVKPVFNWNKSHFLDLYYSLEHEDGTNAPADRFHRNVNTQLHEGPTAFYAENTKMIFTRNNLINGKKGESSDGIIKLKLYLSEREGDNWSKPSEFPYNSNEYSVGHPSITEDGLTLYFASDMPEGFGGTDIYRSTFSEGQWSKPENLGDKINTKGNEMFPFYHETTGVLYFSSNGHGGLGGLDILHHNLQTNEEPKNLGFPINSRADDFGFILDQNGESGYFSSNRKGGKGDDDIYHFNVQNEIIDVLVYDQNTNESISSAIVELHEGVSIEALSKTNPGGEVMFQVNPQKNYLLKVKKEGYQSAEVLIDVVALQASNFLQVKVPLTYTGNTVSGKANNFESEPENYRRLVFGEDSIREMAPIEEFVPIEEHQSISESHEGQPAITQIQYYKLVNNTDYQDFLVKENNVLWRAGTVFSGNEEKIALPSANTSDEIIFYMEASGYEVEYIKIENIYYDLDKSIIRNDASVQLDKLVNLLNDHSQLSVKLSAFTDSRGSTDYNEKLALRRVLSAQRYLILEGIAKERIQIDHLGEQGLVNECADGVDCEEYKHQLNRRTEFKIISN